ncbi:biotin/lipoyl-containing protein [Anaerosporobacter sp.]
MKNYTITVNGNVYEVSVEEGISGAAKAPTAPVAKAPVQKETQTPVAPSPAPKAAPVSAQGSVKVNAPMPGKILEIKANVGQAVKRGEVLVILEAMKMENEIVAPSGGTVASINVAVGNSVESGDVLVTLN